MLQSESHYRSSETAQPEGSSRHLYRTLLCRWRPIGRERHADILCGWHDGCVVGSTPSRPSQVCSGRNRILTECKHAVPRHRKGRTSVGVTGTWPTTCGTGGLFEETLISAALNPDLLALRQAGISPSFQTLSDGKRIRGHIEPEF